MRTVSTAAMACALALAGCQSITTADQTIADAQSTVARVCEIEPAAHLAFVAFVPLARIEAGAVAAEAEAHAAAAAICAAPPHDVVTAATAILAAYRAVLAAQAAIPAAD
jgi:hypothetical protein